MLLNFPLPWLLGPIATCLAAALWGVELRADKLLGDGMRTILGVAVGATVTVPFLQDLAGIWKTLLIIPAMVMMIGLLGVWYFRRFVGYDFPTAYYAAMPGGLQDMIVLGEEAGGKVRTISLIQAMRVLIIVVILPIILVTVLDIDLTRAPGAAIRTFSADQIVILAFCGICGWRLAKAIGLFGASILGPLILASLASLAGLLNTRPPAEAIWAAQYFIALGIGVKYVGITHHELRNDVVAGIGFCVLLLLLCSVIMLGVISFGLASTLETILSFTPGGQAELVVLALVAGADVGFIVAHQLFRIIFVIIGAPIMARIFAPKPPG